MSTRRRSSPTIAIFLLLLLVVSIPSPTTGSDPARKLEGTPVPGPADVKCTPSCVTPSSPPPPPIVYLSPPPPPPPPPVEYPPPKPPKQKPPTSYICPPPPSSMVYLTGPPGDLYPVDKDFNGAERNSAFGLPFLVVVGLAGLLALW